MLFRSEMPSDQNMTEDPPLARWEVAVVWVAATAMTFGWAAIYALVWLLICRTAAAVDWLAGRAHEVCVRRSCRKGKGSRPGD